MDSLGFDNFIRALKTYLFKFRGRMLVFSVAPLTAYISYLTPSTICLLPATEMEKVVRR